jgi:hypothetical protein
MRGPLLQLLTELMSIGNDHEELFDSDVRDAMSDVIFRSYLKPDPSYVIPAKFGMFSSDADGRIYQTLSIFLDRACPTAPSSFQERLAVFQDSTVTVQDGLGFDDFFGWYNPEDFDSLGNSIYLQRVRRENRSC